MKSKRREFIKMTGISGLGMTLIPSLIACSSNDVKGMNFGLVTYNWGKDWDLPTLINNCEDAGYAGLELRTSHAHGVETSLSSADRQEVKQRFADSSVTCVGYGSNFEYHDPDQTKLQWNIDQTKEYIKLCHDIGATGLKVKPNTLPDEVSRDKTIAQIASSLNEVGRYAQDYNQTIRVEAHGRKTSELPNMKAIFDQVSEPNVKICWNCNAVDLNAPGLESNFNLVKQWIGDTIHIHNLRKDDYPYEEFFSLLRKMNYYGWILLEDGEVPEDILGSMKEQKAEFVKLTSE